MPARRSLSRMETSSPSVPNTASRREFLRTGSVASAMAASGLVGVQQASGEETTSKSALETINIGIIGTGGRGGGALKDSLTINSNVRLVAMADLNAGKCHSLRRSLARRFSDKVAVTDDKIYDGLEGYRRVLEDKDVDLVIQTTSPGFRPRHIAEAVDAGKHVFAEKPSCVDPAGYHICLAAHDKAVEQGTAVVTGTQYRRQTNYVELMKRIHAGEIGDVVSATARYCSNGIWYRGRQPGMTDVEYQTYNWMHFVWLSGDQICEQAVHNIDAMAWLMGENPISAFGSGGQFTRPQDSEMWDNVSVDYEFSGNRLLSFMCRQLPRAASESGNVVYCTGGVAHIPSVNGTAQLVDREGKTIWSMKGNIGAAYQQEHKDLVDSIRAGKPIVELKQTADSSLIAVMGRLAAYTGQKVTWDFVSKESKLDLFPKDLTVDTKLPEPAVAAPGRTKLI